MGAKHGPRTTLGPLYRWVAILARRHGLETKTSANADVRPHTLVNVNTIQSTQRTEQLKRKQIRTNQNCTTQHYTRQHDTTNPNSILMAVGTLIDKLITYQLSISISFHTTDSSRIFNFLVIFHDIPEEGPFLFANKFFTQPTVYSLNLIRQLTKSAIDHLLCGSFLFFLNPAP